MFDFHLIEELQNSTTQEKSCKELGYDGLAILNTPETYRYALKLTDYFWSVLPTDIYIGVHFRPELVESLWDDGTPPRSDAPFYRNPPFAVPWYPCGGLDIYRRLRMLGGHTAVPALCGNHKNTASEGMGSTKIGDLQTTSRTVLSVSKISSYLECAVLCSMSYDCRAAEFNSDLLTCTVVGEHTSTGTLAPLTKPEIKTFIRIFFR
ncbi:hypothetical protein ElyMa_001061300 [Elysia marginata]|uniref:Apple domain-containing protein n=1 Tax=Elysia marginata TaxID=1093978 RepID=A0AAV4HRB9_9GAST|nr:hypothetical protein ElyMa_001061300 [Elysia marginata]